VDLCITEVGGKKCTERDPQMQDEVGSAGVPKGGLQAAEENLFLKA
jgi:hypothetical protein